MSVSETADAGPLGSQGQLTPIKYTGRYANKATVATPSGAYKEMSKHWELILALRGGTLKMREEKEKWLPREMRESVGAYENRLKRSVCYGALNRTVDTLAGLPFMRAMTIEGLPSELEYLQYDADSTETDLTGFGHTILKEIIALGLTHILVDMPYFEGAITLKDQEDNKIRPYFCHISPTSLIGWTTERRGGLEILTSIRIKEYVVVSDEDWSEKEVEQIRVIKPDLIEIWREREVRKKEEWYIYNTLPNNLGKIPLVTIYGNRTGFMQAKPPLEDLAFLNLRHYQKLSDLDNIEHVANVPFLFGSGFDDAEMEGIEIGPNRIITSSNKEADLKYVEHTGQAIGVSQRSMKYLEERMAAMGADLIVRKSVDRQTATARQIDQSESISMLQIMINNLETGLEAAIGLAGEWVSTEANNVQIDVGDYLDTPDNGPNLVDILLQMVADNQGMTLEEAQTELKRRGILSDMFKLGKKKTDISKETGVKPVKNSVDNPEV